MRRDAVRPLRVIAAVFTGTERCAGFMDDRAFQGNDRGILIFSLTTGRSGRGIVLSPSPGHSGKPLPELIHNIQGSAGLLTVEVSTTRQPVIA